jgi:hypothetical protein
MSDFEHISIKPDLRNIGSKKKRSIFDDNKDPDVQKILNKKRIDILDVKTPTEEDISSKKQSDEGASPILIIVLVVIVVILLIIIIYYVLKQNKITPIPENIVKSHARDSPPPPSSGSRESEITKPKNFVEPTEVELNEILNKIEHSATEPDDFNDTPHNIEMDHDEDESNESYVIMENLIMGEDDADKLSLVDADEIDEFHKQIINQA